jgi:hypothetical protein
MGLSGIFILLSTPAMAGSLMGQSHRDDILVVQNMTPSGYKSRRDVINPMVLLVSSLFTRTPLI